MRRPSFRKAGSICISPPLTPHFFLCHRLQGSNRDSGGLPRSLLHRGPQAGMETGKSGLWNPHSPELSWKQQEVIFKKQHPSAVTWEISLSPSSPCGPPCSEPSCRIPFTCPKAVGEDEGDHCQRKGVFNDLMSTSGRGLGFPRRLFMCAWGPHLASVRPREVSSAFQVPPGNLWQPGSVSTSYANVLFGLMRSHLHV